MDTGASQRLVVLLILATCELLRLGYQFQMVIGRLGTVGQTALSAAPIEQCSKGTAIATVTTEDLVACKYVACLKQLLESWRRNYVLVNITCSLS